MARKPRAERPPEAFPTWGAIALPAGVLWGTLLGVGLGAWLGNWAIGAAIGAGLGVGIGLALFAAGVVVASSRTRK